MFSTHTRKQGITVSCLKLSYEKMTQINAALIGIYLMIGKTNGIVEGGKIPLGQSVFDPTLLSIMYP